MPSSFKFIPDSFACGCTSLNEITIPNSENTNEVSSFEGCENLTKIIPISVVSIEKLAFRNCTSLKQIEKEISADSSVKSKQKIR